MKRGIFLLIFLFFGVMSYGRTFFVEGKVYDNFGQPVSYASVSLKGTNFKTLTDEYGYFKFDGVPEGTYVLNVVSVGFKEYSKKILIENDLRLEIRLEPDQSTELDNVIVKATRADITTPVAYTDIPKPLITRSNLGQDVPFVLKLAPSITVSSDAGTGIGYTQLWIRGTDPTRINITLNGVPLNDAESHGVWWVDIPDFLSSVENIQIQRGVGTSTNGAAAFGASINLKTTKIYRKPYAELATTFGSFNTLKNTIKLGTGIINKHFSFDVRLSKIHSDGYIDRAWANLKSFYISGAYIANKTLLRAILFSGLEETYQAWYGVPKEYLDTNRTYNPYTYDNEIDHYGQTHFQFFIVHKFNENFKIETALHYTKGAGYYEQYKNNRKLSDYKIEPFVFGEDTIFKTDLIQRKWLDNDFYGVVASAFYKNGIYSSVIGGAWNKYYGLHFGRILWLKYNAGVPIRYQWYNSDGLKYDFNIFWKQNLTIGKFNAFIDIQYRKINYKITGIDDDLRDIGQVHNYNFFNPKAGMIFNINEFQNLYATFGVANREPKRSDFTDAPMDKIPKPETLFDYELGYKLNTPDIFFNLNLYYMDYKNQLVITGEINDVGTPIMVNVPHSFREGIELVWGFKPVKFINWNANLTLSRNKILNFTAYIDNWDYWDDPAHQPLQYTEYYPITDISFSPSIIAASMLSFNIFKGFSVDLNSKYVSRQYIDNTSNKERSLDPYFVNDLRFYYHFSLKPFSSIQFNFQINNILDEKYETFAWVYRYYYGGKEYEMNGYFPQAGRNYLLGIDIAF